MRRLVVRNVGPIKSVDIKLNRVNVFIGPQSSGKSTLAKIISFCTWLEKNNNLTERAVVDGLINRLKRHHRLSSFFDQSSSILYIGENIAFAYNWKTALPIPKRFIPLNYESLNHGEVVFYRPTRVVNPKVIYIPAERNFVSSVSNLKDYSESDDSLQSFIEDWYDAKRNYTSEKPLDVFNLGASYYYNPKIDVDYIQLSDVKKKKILLNDSSSGLQSVVPLYVLIEWMSSGIYEQTKPLSPEENQRIQEMLNSISGNTVNNSYEEKLLQKIKAMAADKLYTHTQFIVEEPEQNLFPKTQMDFLYYLLTSINRRKKHELVITTHSPYILYALNNCMLAYLVKDNLDDSLRESLAAARASIDPNEVSVWSIKDGCLRNSNNDIHKTIQDARGLIRKNYFNDIMSSVMGDFSQLLEFDE